MLAPPSGDAGSGDPVWNTRDFHGFHLPDPAGGHARPGCFGCTGAGGRLAFAYPERGVAFAFTCDMMLWNGLDGPAPRWTPLLTEVSRALRLDS